MNLQMLDVVTGFVFEQVEKIKVRNRGPRDLFMKTTSKQLQDFYSFLCMKVFRNKSATKTY